MIVFLDSNVVIYYIECDPFRARRLKIDSEKLLQIMICWLLVMRFV